jgi:hypothetical protein
MTNPATSILTATLGAACIEVAVADITTLKVDAIVNAAAPPSTTRPRSGRRGRSRSPD